ncbi:malate dehydrogenase, cytoplasmic-like [Battus philenor]|uniref:malate dehydrogenase, cytoplasmic-like n=1 Tax=Battus philenor TaxID=42288 RepID=UPI0035CF0C33
MNFQCEIANDPIKVFIVNPLIPTSQLILLKILSGEIFGDNTPIDLTLMVYSNENSVAETLKVELEKCAFSNTNSVKISTDLPGPKDADIFCVMSDFENPNYFDYENMENETQFDTLYLLIKLANHLEWTEGDLSKEGYNAKALPIFVTDGLLALDILACLSKKLPKNIFFCPSPLEAISKFVLGDYLNVQCSAINDVRVWAANDKVFYIEIEKPLVICDRIDHESHCVSDTISNELLQSLKLDYTQLNTSWLRKEFLEKVASSAARNPYGCIYKAAEFAKSLKQIWKARTGGSGVKVYSNMGVISDGSIGTIEGCPYMLPIVLQGNTWKVNKCFEESAHLKLEIKRITNIVKEQHQKFIPYCKKFLEENVINLAFVPVSNLSGTTDDSSSSPSLLRKSVRFLLLKYSSVLEVESIRTSHRHKHILSTTGALCSDLLPPDHFRKSCVLLPPSGEYRPAV